MTRNHPRGTDDVADLITIYEHLSPALWGMTGLAGRFGWPGLARDLGCVGLARDLVGGGVGAWGVCLFVWRVGLGFGFWFFYIYVSPFFGVAVLVRWGHGVHKCWSGAVLDKGNTLVLRFWLSGRTAPHKERSSS